MLVFGSTISPSILERVEEQLVRLFLSGKFPGAQFKLSGPHIIWEPLPSPSEQRKQSSFCRVLTRGPPQHPLIVKGQNKRQQLQKQMWRFIRNQRTETRELVETIKIQKEEWVEYFTNLYKKDNEPIEDDIPDEINETNITITKEEVEQAIIKIEK